MQSDDKKQREFMYNKGKLVDEFLRMAAISLEGVSVEASFHQDRYGLTQSEMGKPIQRLSCTITKNVSDRPDVIIKFDVSVNPCHLLKCILKRELMIPSDNFDWDDIEVEQVLDIGSSVVGVIV